MKPMKPRSLSATVAMVFLIPALAFAAQKNSTTVQLVKPVKVAGTQLAAGEYKLIWEGNGPNVTVSFMDHKKTVATAPAKLVSDPASQPGAIETDTAADQTQILHAVDLKNVTLQFESSIPAAGN